jgi:hypothetical protein
MKIAGVLALILFVGINFAASEEPQQQPYLAPGSTLFLIASGSSPQLRKVLKRQHVRLTIVNTSEEAQYVAACEVPHEAASKSFGGKIGSRLWGAYIPLHVTLTVNASKTGEVLYSGTMRTAGGNSSSKQQSTFAAYVCASRLKKFTEN